MQAWLAKTHLHCKTTHQPAWVMSLRFASAAVNLRLPAQTQSLQRNPRMPPTAGHVNPFLLRPIHAVLAGTLLSRKSSHLAGKQLEGLLPSADIGLSEFNPTSKAEDGFHCVLCSGLNHRAGRRLLAKQHQQRPCHHASQLCSCEHLRAQPRLAVCAKWPEPAMKYSTRHKRFRLNTAKKLR